MKRARMLKRWDDERLQLELVKAIDRAAVLGAEVKRRARERLKERDAAAEAVKAREPWPDQTCRACGDKAGAVPCPHRRGKVSA